MPDNAADIPEYEEPAVGPTNEQLREASALARRYLAERAVVERLEADLKRANAALTRTRETDLPMAMIACGLTEFKVDGATVSIGMEFQAKQLSDEAGLAWLDQNGHGAIAKNFITVAVPPGPGAEATVRRLMTTIRSDPAANQFAVERSRFVHAQTLGAFVRAEFDARRGDKLPLDRLGVSVRRAAKVTVPKRLKEF